MKKNELGVGGGEENESGLCPQLREMPRWGPGPVQESSWSPAWEASGGLRLNSDTSTDPQKPRSQPPRLPLGLRHLP